MRSSISDPATLTARLRARAQALGFQAFGIAPAAGDPALAGRLAAFIAAGHHGTMAWLEDTLARRASPQAMWPEALSAIVVAMNYGPDHDPLAVTRIPDAGAISVYARGRDYHDVIKGRLKDLAGEVARLAGAEVKVFVDTAPLMEKPLAMAAGIGWQGKHTNLVSRDYGSWLFLGVILTTADLAADAPQEDLCGSCRACLDACPTNAFPAPYQLDARRCISYLTIEHKGHIDEGLRPGIGNRIYGCDDCLAVCPWNKFAEAGRETKLAARSDLNAPSLASLAALDDVAFRALFTASPVKRIGRDRFIRNVLIAIGNSGDPALAVHAERLLGDGSDVVRAMAIWACRRLLSAEYFVALAAARAKAETDAAVAAEWGSILPASAGGG
jgi:epoxyqueuosine reductase